MGLISTSLPRPEASPKAERLGRRLKETIDSFRQENPTLSATEVKHAMQIAIPELGKVVPLLVVEVIVGLLLLAFAAFYLM